jgi:hypothetical protein
MARRRDCAGEQCAAREKLRNSSEELRNSSEEWRSFWEEWRSCWEELRSCSEELFDLTAQRRSCWEEWRSCSEELFDLTAQRRSCWEEWRSCWEELFILTAQRREWGAKSRSLWPQLFNSWPRTFDALEMRPAPGMFIAYARHINGSEFDQEVECAEARHARAGGHPAVPQWTPRRGGLDSRLRGNDRNRTCGGRELITSDVADGRNSACPGLLRRKRSTFGLSLQLSARAFNFRRNRST